MKRLFIATLLLFALSVLVASQTLLGGAAKLGGQGVVRRAAAGGANITFVQNNSIRGTGASTAIAFTSNNTAGNLIVVAVGIEDGTSSISSITDTAGNTYVAIGSIFTDGGLGFSGQIWYAKNCVGGANTVTVTPSTTIATSVLINEYSDASTTAPFDVNSSAAGLGGTADSGSAVTTGTGDLIFGFGITAQPPSAGSGFTQRDNIVFNYYHLTEDKQAGAPGSYNATASTTNLWIMLMAAFKN